MWEGIRDCENSIIFIFSPILASFIYFILIPWQVLIDWENLVHQIEMAFHAWSLRNLDILACNCWKCSQAFIDSVDIVWLSSFIWRMGFIIPLISSRSEVTIIFQISLCVHRLVLCGITSQYKGEGKISSTKRNQQINKSPSLGPSNLS